MNRKQILLEIQKSFTKEDKKEPFINRGYFNETQKILGLLRCHGGDFENPTYNAIYDIVQDIFKKVEQELEGEDKELKERNNVRDFIKKYDKNRGEAISFETLQKNITFPEKILRTHITKMLEDGEIYEAKPECFRWLG